MDKREKYSYTFTLYVLYCLTLRLISAPTQTIKGLYIPCSSMSSTDKNWPPWSRRWSLCITITDHDLTEDISTYIKGMELCTLTCVWKFVLSCYIYHYSSMFIIVWHTETVPATVLWAFLQSYHTLLSIDPIVLCVHTVLSVLILSYFVWFLSDLSFLFLNSYSVYYIVLIVLCLFVSK